MQKSRSNTPGAFPFYLFMALLLSGPILSIAHSQLQQRSEMRSTQTALIGQGIQFESGPTTKATTANLPAAKLTVAEHWAQSGFSLEHLDLRPSRCERSETDFRQCLAALAVLASHQKEPFLLGVAGALKNHPDVDLSSIKPYLGLEAGLRQREKTDSKVALTLKERTEKQKMFIFKQAQLEAQLFKNKAARQAVDIEKILGVLRTGIVISDSKKINMAMIAGQAMNEMLTVKDAHASIRPLSEFEEQSKGADVLFYGVGVEIRILAGAPQVQKVTPGGPAAAAKVLRKGDIILKVDETDLLGLDLDKVVAQIRGEKGKPVELLIRRGTEERKVTIIRGPVEQKNVVHNVLRDFEKETHHLKLGSFVDESACSKLEAILQKLDSQAGVIFDLRSNGGGLLDQALCIGGLLMGDKVIVGVKNLKTNTMEWQRSEPVGNAWFVTQKTEAPLVVLIDADSASASEILAGAIQDHARGWVVGETSFGKATVQTLSRYNRKGVRAIVGETTARFYQPKGRTNQLVGIIPDFTVSAKPYASEEDRFSPREGDLFPNALTAEATEWKQPRPAEVEKINDCLAQKRSEAIYSKQLAEEGDSDFQLLKAQEILLCAESL